MAGAHETVEDLYEHAPCGFLSAEADGTIVRANATFLRWLGLEREAVVGRRRFQDLLTVGGRIYHETHYAPLLRMQGSVREIAVELVRADGSRLPALVNSVRADDGSVRTTVFDATERKRYERELLMARDRERAARERVEELQRRTAALLEEQRDVAHTLQRSLLSLAAPVDPRVELATAYHPALEHLQVGGDWHDAFLLPGDRLGFAVGDVVGRGLLAASAMGQLRSAVRALALAGAGPGDLLGHLDAFVEQVPTACYATLVYGEADLATGEVRCASAGHPPLLLRFADAPPELVMAGRSAPLGVPPEEGPRPDTSFSLAPGDGFLLYTDGLVERRGEAIDAGLERLTAAVRARAAAPPERLVVELVGALAERGAEDDDICLLALRRISPDPLR